MLAQEAGRAFQAERRPRGWKCHAWQAWETKSRGVSSTGAQGREGRVGKGEGSLRGSWGHWMYLL